MDPGTTKTITVVIENITTTPAKLHVVINDFTAGNDELGQPNILLNEEDYAPSHSLKRLTTKVPDFTLGPLETKNISVKIAVPADAAGGGYFGAVRFGAANPTDPTKQVSLSGSVGSLVLLRVNGDIKEKLGVESFDVRQRDQAGTFFTSNKNLSMVVRFRNSGNVQVEPFGKVQLKKSGKVVATYEVNTNQFRGSVLPDSVRRFTTKMDKVGSFGKYTLDGNFGYGSTGQLLTTKATFYVVPIYLMILAGLAVVVILLLIFVLPRMLRSYNRRVIRRAGRRR
jgi:hypothetical protein